MILYNIKKSVFAFATVLIAGFISSCSSFPDEAVKVKALPKIYPDYTDVTIPKNIAPLNFMMRDKVDGVAVYVNGDDYYSSDDGDVRFDIGTWRELLSDNAGKKIEIKVLAKYGDEWREYKPFNFYVSNDTIDPCLTYRLIEPDYEVWNNVVLQQRDITSFDTKNIADYNLQENRCMNCHIIGNRNPNLSMMYVRGKGGGAILNKDGKLRKLDIKAKNDVDSMISSSVYYGFDKTGRYITFSTNIIVPSFHSAKSKRLEVYDKKSDVYVADLEKNIIYNNPVTADTSKLETFPVFSPDDKYLYYCSADMKPLLDNDIKALKYALVRVPFDKNTGKTGNKVDTLYNKQSVCHPKISPDGRFIVYTVADYGTFPIWHREADLQLMNLKTGVVDSLQIVNSNRSDTYHSWSSNSRWLVFASKRDDGLYGKPYFCYIDKNGKAYKPFVLPQKDPEFYDNCLKSFNVPELAKGSLPFDATDVERVMKQESEKFKLVSLKKTIK
nr:PD40 domain-containing protein [Prevotella sp.]